MDPNSPLVSLAPMFIIMGIMYFLMIRPQMKKEKDRKAALEQLKKGDKIVAGGIYGEVVSTDTTSVLAQVDSNTKIRFDKSVVQALPKN